MNSHGYARAVRVGRTWSLNTNTKLFASHTNIQLFGKHANITRCSASLLGDKTRFSKIAVKKQCFDKDLISFFALFLNIERSLDTEHLLLRPMIYGG